MLVAGIRRTGGDVGMLDVPGPRPLAGDEVLIQVRAAGVGNWDEFVRTGGWDVGRRPPMALGVEAAGLVTAVGSMVTGWASGDEVMTHPLPLRDQGTWAPTLIAPSASIARKPAGVSWEAAAAFPVPALTAAQVLDEVLGVGPGDRLLVNGAGGVTGRLLVSLGSLRGAEVIATAGPHSRAPVAALGVRDVIDYHEQDWPDQVLAITDGTGVSAAVNATPDGAGDAIRAVRDGGGSPRRIVLATPDARRVAPRRLRRRIAPQRGRLNPRASASGLPRASARVRSRTRSSSGRSSRSWRDRAVGPSAGPSVRPLG